MIVITPLTDLEGYCSIPSVVHCCSRLDVRSAIETEGNNLQTIPIEPYTKYYDLLESPRDLPATFDTTHWKLFIAYEGAVRVGGAILAMRSTDFDMLEARNDLAVLVDIRVHPEYQGNDIGTALFQAAALHAQEQGCTELIVETQDTNVPACRFYYALGCRLKSADPMGYQTERGRPRPHPGLAVSSPPEAKLIWALDLKKGEGDVCSSPLRGRGHG